MKNVTRHYRNNGWDITVCTAITEDTIRYILDSLDTLPEVGKRLRRRGVLPFQESANKRVFVKCSQLALSPSKLKRTIRTVRNSGFLNEGRMYEKYSLLGIPVPRIVMYGKKTILRIKICELIVVNYIEGQNILEIFRTSGDSQWIFRAAKFLSKIHCSGLTHGDCMLHNFFYDGEKILALDLEKSEQLSRPSQCRDLIDFGLSILRVSNDISLLKEALSVYASNSKGPLPLSIPQLIESSASKC